MTLSCMRRAWCALVIFHLGGLWVVAALAFTHVPIGSVLDNMELPALTGGRQALLSNAPANVFIFFKPGLEFSNAFLKQIAACHRDMAGKPVHWVAVVSGRIPKSEAQAVVKEAGLDMPVLIDEGDVLFGRLGVVLYPTVGITDADHRLVAYEPFRKVHYLAVIRARIRRLLGEISDAELARILNPPPAIQDSDMASARRRLKLAERQFQAGEHEKALGSVDKSLELDSAFAAAHTLRGKILAAQGDAVRARGAFEKALELDPQDAAAREGLRALD